MTNWQTIADAVGYPQATPYGPERQFYQYGLGAFRPGASRVREAFYQAQNPLMAQYYLAEPFLGGDQAGTGFGDFMTQMGTSGYSPYGSEDLRTRAEQAAFLGGLNENAYRALALAAASGPVASAAYDVTADDAFSPAQWDQFRDLDAQQRALYRTTFGTGAGEGDAYVSPALAQQQLVQLMALQRAPETAGGDPRMYGAGSRIGQAILQQLGGIQSQLEITDPETNFLDWYLARTAGGGAGGWWNQVT
jgi:hypothetical protein